MWILPPPVLIVKLPLQSPLWHLLSAQVGSQHVVVGFQSDPQTFLWTWAGDGPRVSSWWWRWRYRGVSCRPPSQSWSPLLVPHPFLSAHTTGVRLRMWCRKRCSSQSTSSFVSWSFFFFSGWLFYFFVIKGEFSVCSCVLQSLSTRSTVCRKWKATCRGWARVPCQSCCLPSTCRSSRVVSAPAATLKPRCLLQSQQQHHPSASPSLAPSPRWLQAPCGRSWRRWRPPASPATWRPRRFSCRRSVSGLLSRLETVFDWRWDERQTWRCYDDAKVLTCLWRFSFIQIILR